MSKLSVMIVSHPGAWQRVLQKNLEVYPFLKISDVTSGSLSAAQLAKENHPDLVLIDSSIPFAEAIALVQGLKQENPNTRSIVVTDTTEQRRRITRLGADYAISFYNFESQIGTIFHQIWETLIDKNEGSETHFKLDPSSTN